MKPLNTQLQKTAGLVLTGGYSRRLGVDKGLINYHGAPQRIWLAEWMRQWCSQVFYSCREGQGDELPKGSAVITDKYEHTGPMGALLTAFESTDHMQFLVLPVDVPLIEAKSIDRLMSFARDLPALNFRTVDFPPNGNSTHGYSIHDDSTHGHATPGFSTYDAVLFRSPQRPYAEPLLGLWRPTAAGVLKSNLSNGQLAMHKVLPALRIAELEIDDRELTNVNTPADLREVQLQLSDRSNV